MPDMVFPSEEKTITVLAGPHAISQKWFAF
jgi:hypothetical protein